jgi:Glycosyl transferase family 1
VLTSGNGFLYFKGRSCIASLTPTQSFYYSENRGRISGWATLGAIRSLARLAKVKRINLDRLLDQIQPDIAVIDSEYSIGPLRRRKIPIVAINNSEVVVTEYLRGRFGKRGVRSQFWFIEFMDYLFHRTFCDLVLSPFPLPRPTRHFRFRRVGLIIRSEVKRLTVSTPRLPHVTPRQIRTVVFMLSGSVHASKIDFEGRAFPFAVEIVGRSGPSNGNVTYHGRLMDNFQLLNRADVLVINGGYSALSEAFAFRKPVFVIPVPGHAEQLVNAQLAADLGLGFVARESDILDRLMEMYQQDRWIGLAPMPIAFELNGDREAAAAILDLAGEQRL